MLVVKTAREMLLSGAFRSESRVNLMYLSDS